jgi:hypothetical protein
MASDPPLPRRGRPDPLAGVRGKPLSRIAKEDSAAVGAVRRRVLSTPRPVEATRFVSAI